MGRAKPTQGIEEKGAKRIFVWDNNSRSPAGAGSYALFNQNCCFVWGRGNQVSLRRRVSGMPVYCSFLHCYVVSIMTGFTNFNPVFFFWFSVTASAGEISTVDRIVIKVSILFLIRPGISYCKQIIFHLITIYFRITYIFLPGASCQEKQNGESNTKFHNICGKNIGLSLGWLQHWPK